MTHAYSIGAVPPRIKAARRAAFEEHWLRANPEPLSPEKWSRAHPSPTEVGSKRYKLWRERLERIREKHNLWRDKRDEELHVTRRVPSASAQTRVKLLREGRLRRRPQRHLKVKAAHRRASMKAYSAHLTRYCQASCHDFAANEGALWLLHEDMPYWLVMSGHKAAWQRRREHFRDMFLRCERRCYDAALGRKYRKMRGWEKTERKVIPSLVKLERAVYEKYVDRTQHPERYPQEPLPARRPCLKWDTEKKRIKACWRGKKPSAGETTRKMRRAAFQKKAIPLQPKVATT